MILITWKSILEFLITGNRNRADIDTSFRKMTLLSYVHTLYSPWGGELPFTQCDKH